MSSGAPDRGGAALSDRPAAAPLDDVAVIIVNHGTAALLADCLRSLADGGLEGLSAAVWVVDNASPDDSVALLRDQFSWVHLVESDQNLGFSSANNLGLRDAGFAAAGDDPPARPRYRHALILNPDTVVPTGAVRQMVEDLEAEPSLAVVGPRLLLPDGSLDPACRRSFPSPAVSFYRLLGLSRRYPRHPRFGRYNMTFLPEDQATDVDSVVGACMLVRGAAINQVGLFDERFWMYGEDLDWCMRFKEAGWRVAYRPRTLVHHVKRAASRASPRARFEFQRAMWLFYDKHYASRTAWPVHLLVLLGLALRGGPRLVAEMSGRGRSA
ncbi:MAG TPA: glycosyltransferase family 2 protein [Anaerolineae bacterium]|nr:glycosyltransferase family 2 protein [Ardenticatenia bacterium]MBK8539976.1 glycosyltransferase family 2 protein [Ardenticatenia bacterium]HQZ69786.1 glycosyltransferase family 2 protein [Anaerolineae bacterium]HRA18981.1 glycosyltransferase family 2 protein [Anaerolineae bacterium]